MEISLPIAHTGHYTWVLYIPSILVVLFAIVRTTISERKAAREERERSGAGSR